MFEDIKSAMSSCDHDSQCQGVWDRGCEEKPNEVFKCYVGYDYHGTTATNCIYDKIGKY